MKRLIEIRSNYHDGVYLRCVTDDNHEVAKIHRLAEQHGLLVKTLRLTPPEMVVKHLEALDL